MLLPPEHLAEFPAAHTVCRVFITPAFENSYAEGEIKNWFLDELDGFGQARRLSERCGGTAADKLPIALGPQLAEDTHGRGWLALAQPIGCAE
ncbi:hypothetical protein PGH47_41460 [Streptomyces sp. HUAS 31]|uniref:hypothetical protein n=1 Tax=Streptomyces sp. HUAS 31 TaxID=3020055 RepID=UPI0023069EFE|nr:hypothetical protein [Streptomyces sp. HUAS 31]WCE01789.1 hypothetical protein PGH47_41460 [Streptomyces sp. HUAS 31]